MLEIFDKVVLESVPTDNPYLNKGHSPVDTEWTASTPDLKVIGDIPKDLNGVYLRNGHNQIHAPLGKYHPFDGDGMIHGMHLANGKATYRNRFVRTTGFLAEEAEFAERCARSGITFTGPRPATIRILADKVMVLAEFSINRKDFGIVYAGKADDLIRDDVLIRLELNPARTK